MSPRILILLTVLCLVSIAARVPCVSSSAADGPVVINEFSYDDTGRDDREFVELYNRSRASVDISSWELVAEDPLGRRARFVIPKNTVIAAGAYYVFGSAKVANVDQVVGVTDIWENSQEALQLLDSSSKAVDTVVFETWRSTWRIGKPAGDGIWPDFVSRDSEPTSWSRVRDGFDSQNNRDFRITRATPGKTNDLPRTDWIDDFDKSKVGDAVAGWIGSFENPRIVDPTVPDTFNPQKLPASPQGGNAAVFWDANGGGNMCALLRDGVRDVIVECYVWIDARPLTSLDRSAWSLGVQGGTGSFYDFADVSGTQPQFRSNGNTGVAWTFEATDRGATLYLVDHGDGGWGSGARTAPKVLGKIALDKVKDTGWRRLRLETRGTLVEGYFGGTPGCADGQRFSGKLASPAVGGVYVGFRERIAQPKGWRPFTCDALRIGSSTSKVAYSGTGVPTTRGLPRLSIDVPALPGRRDFHVLARGLVPRGSTLTFFSLVKLPVPVDLQILGARKGCFLYLDPLVASAGSANDSGEFDALFPIPCVRNAAGVELHFQVLDFDRFLLSRFPVGTSRLMTVTVGR